MNYYFYFQAALLSIQIIPRNLLQIVLELKSKSSNFETDQYTKSKLYFYIPLMNNQNLKFKTIIYDRIELTKYLRINVTKYVQDLYTKITEHFYIKRHWSVERYTMLTDRTF